MVTVVLEINKSSFSALGGTARILWVEKQACQWFALKHGQRPWLQGWFFFLLSLEERLHLSVWLSLRGLHRKTCEPQRHSSQVVPWLSFPQAGAAAHVAGSISRKQRPCGEPRCVATLSKPGVLTGDRIHGHVFKCTSATVLSRVLHKQNHDRF